MAIKIKGREVQLILALLFALLLLVLLIPWGSQQKSGRSILLKDPSLIDQISIMGPGGSVKLERSDEGWLLPGGEQASQVAVDNLIFAAGRLQVDAVLDKDPAWDSLPASELSYYSRGRLVLRYESLNSEGRFMVRPEGTEKKFAVSLPGFPELDLDRVFSNLESHYLERLLISMLPAEILSIEVKKRGHPAFRFTSDKNGELTCLMPESDSLVPLDMLDEEAVRMLFTYFTGIRFEEKAAGFPGPAEALSGERWLANISLESFSGEKHSLQVYSLPGTEGVGTHMFNAMLIHNQNPEPLLVKYIYLDVLMRDLSAYIGDNSLRQ